MKARSLKTEELEMLDSYPLTPEQKTRVENAWRHTPSIMFLEQHEKKDIVLILPYLYMVVLLAITTLSYTYFPNIINVMLILAWVYIIATVFLFAFAINTWQAPFPYDTALLSKKSLDRYFGESQTPLLPKIIKLILTGTFGLYLGVATPYTILASLWVSIVVIGPFVLPFVGKAYVSQALNGYRDDLIKPSNDPTSFKSTLHETFEKTTDKNI